MEATTSAPASHSKQLDAAKQHAAKYAHTDPLAAYSALFLTLAIHLSTFLVWPAAVAGGPPWVLAWALVHSMNLTRAFVLAHDCAHGSAFWTRQENEWLGALVGALVMMPFGMWRRRHLEHHSSLGIEEEQHNDHNRTVFWTTRQWRQWPLWRKSVMRIARDPFMFFSIGATAIIVGLGGGIPKAAAAATKRKTRAAKTARKQRKPTGTAFALAVICTQSALLWWGLGDLSAWLLLLKVYMALVTPMACCIGMALMQLQHHVNTPYRVPRADHSRELAAYLGSTCLVVPWWFKWCTLGVEYHHLHHLAPQVPCYKLQACHDAAPPGTWDGITVVGPGLALRSMFNVMWDEDAHMYVAFPEHEALFAWLGKLRRGWNC